MKVGFGSKNRNGFTLIELLVVIAIIGILATVVIINVAQARQKANDGKVLTELTNSNKGAAACLAEGGAVANPASLGDNPICNTAGAGIGGNWAKLGTPNTPSAGWSYCVNATDPGCTAWVPFSSSLFNYVAQSSTRTVKMTPLGTVASAGGNGGSGGGSGGEGSTATITVTSKSPAGGNTPTPISARLRLIDDDPSTLAVYFSSIITSCTVDVMPENGAPSLSASPTCTIQPNQKDVFANIPGNIGLVGDYQIRVTGSNGNNSASAFWYVHFELSS